jgi:MoaA/NifB/PqqE/SkfB family radical SAM enzyme
MAKLKALIANPASIIKFAKAPGKNILKFSVGANLSRLWKNMGRSEDKKLLIMTGFSCNNNCIFCSIRPNAKNNPDRSTEKILENLKQGIKQGYKRIEFTGGEPTIRPDIFFLIKTARDLGYKKIEISTNGRFFSSKEFCQRAVESGLGAVYFTLNSFNSRLGDAISRTPGSFEQTVSGIRNVLNYHDLNAAVNTVVTKINCRHLSKIGEYIADLGIKQWNILDLIPAGNAEKFYKNLSLKIPVLSAELNKIRKIRHKFESIGLFDFSLCLFSPRFFADKEFYFMTAKRKAQVINQVGYNPNRFRNGCGKTVEDCHKRRIEICKFCRFSDSCGGVWKNYLKLYGDEEIKILAEKNNCILR